MRNETETWVDLQPATISLEEKIAVAIFDEGGLKWQWGDGPD